MSVGTENINFIFLSDFLGWSVVNGATNQTVGKVVDLAAVTGQVYPKVTGLITKVKGKKDPVYIPWSTVSRSTPQRSILIDTVPDFSHGNGDTRENEILLKKSFLDRQLISTSGFKVVRVNDLQLLLENSVKGNPNLWLVHVDIGVKGLLRRMGYLPVFNIATRFLLDRDMKEKFVSWKNVAAATTTSVSGSLHLKLDASKLSEIHPADLADIVEDLGIDERISLIESLDASTAASTLKEIPLRIRVQIAETLDTAKLAALVNESQLDEAVDLLDELSPEIRNVVYQLLPPEKTSELRELSKLSVYGVGSIMNTDFITAKAADTVAAVLEHIKNEAEKTEILNYVYILDADGKLKGVVTLRQLLSFEPETIMADIMWEHVVSTAIEAKINRVANIFFKYNFVALPVVDDDGVMQGIITMRDALEMVFSEMKQESNA